MAKVKEFSHMNVPLLWFDIVSKNVVSGLCVNSENICIPLKNTPLFFLQVMFELPVPLRNRFHLYLNVLPIVDSVTFYGLFVCGVGLLIFAISKVSFNISSSLSSPHHISKRHGRQNGSQYRSNVYMPCEESLIPANLVKCPPSYLAEKNATEMHDINLKHTSYCLDNEMPLIEDNESELSSEGVSSEETAETQTPGENQKVTENDSFETDYSRALIRGREKQTFSWSIEPEMHPDLLEVFRENGTQSLLHGDDELSSSTENLKEIVEVNLRIEPRAV